MAKPTLAYMTATYADGNTRIWSFEWVDPNRLAAAAAAIDHLDAAPGTRHTACTPDPGSLYYAEYLARTGFLPRADQAVGAPLHPDQRRTAETLTYAERMTAATAADARWARDFNAAAKADRDARTVPARPITRPTVRTAPEGEGDWTLTAAERAGADL